MTREEIRATVWACLIDVAPDVADQEVSDDVDLRDELDLDSMDVLRWVQEIHKRLGISIPEEDYERVGTLGDAVEYIASRIS